MIVHIARRLELIRARLQSELCQFAREGSLRLSQVTLDHVLSHFDTENAVRAVTEAAHDPDLPRLKALLKAFFELRHESARLHTFSLDLAVQTLIRYEAIAADKEPNAASRQVAGDMKSALLHLPGDAFFLGSLADSLAEGYVAYLRLIREIRTSDISTGYALEQSRAVRVSRLTSPYIFGLTQQLGLVFSSIGFPDAYHDYQRTIASNYHELTRRDRSDPHKEG